MSQEGGAIQPIVLPIYLFNNTLCLYGHVNIYFILHLIIQCFFHLVVQI